MHDPNPLLVRGWRVKAKQTRKRNATKTSRNASVLITSKHGRRCIAAKALIRTPTTLTGMLCSRASRER